MDRHVEGFQELSHYLYTQENKYDWLILMACQAILIDSMVIILDKNNRHWKTEPFFINSINFNQTSMA